MTQAVMGQDDPAEVEEAGEEEHHDRKDQRELHHRLSAGFGSA
jgi:hypothetical protein